MEELQSKGETQSCFCSERSFWQQGTEEQGGTRLGKTGPGRAGERPLAGRLFERVSGHELVTIWVRKPT